MKEKEVYKHVVETQKCCQLCGAIDHLHNHHIRYGACGRKTYIGNVIRLCGDFSENNCHRKVHSNKKYWQPILIQKINEIEGIECM